MAKVINVNLTQEGSTLASMKTTVDTVWAVNKYECCLDGFDTQEFLKALNEGEFQENSRVVAHNGSDYVFFDDKAKALVCLKECHDKLLEDEESSKEDYLQDDDDYEDGIL